MTTVPSRRNCMLHDDKADISFPSGRYGKKCHDYAKLQGGRCLTNGKIVSLRQRILVRCDCSYEWHTTPNRILTGNREWCPRCAGPSEQYKKYIDQIALTFAVSELATKGYTKKQIAASLSVSPSYLSLASSKYSGTSLQDYCTQDELNSATEKAQGYIQNTLEVSPPDIVREEVRLKKYAYADVAKKYCNDGWNPAVVYSLLNSEEVGFRHHLRSSQVKRVVFTHEKEIYDKYYKEAVSLIHSSENQIITNPTPLKNGKVKAVNEDHKIVIYCALVENKEKTSHLAELNGCTPDSIRRWVKVIKRKISAGALKVSEKHRELARQMTS